MKKIAYIIAGKANSGKTTSSNLLSQKLFETGYKFVEYFKLSTKLEITSIKDFTKCEKSGVYVFEKDSIYLAVFNVGDKAEQINTLLTKIIKMYIDKLKIVVFNHRVKGDTIRAVDKFIKKYEFESQHIMLTDFINDVEINCRRKDYIYQLIENQTGSEPSNSTIRYIVTYDVSGDQENALSIRNKIREKLRTLNGKKINQSVWSIEVDEGLSAKEIANYIKNTVTKDGLKQPITLFVIKDSGDSYKEKISATENND